MKHTAVARLVAGVLLAAAIGVVPAHAAACTAAPHPQGEWPSYGMDLTNARNQVNETSISAANVGTLEPKWNLSLAGAGASGSFQSSPAVAGGCVFIASDTGWVFALDADTGALQWHVQLPVGGQVAGIFGLAVADGRVHGASVDANGPFAFALDVSTGAELWRSDPIEGIGTTINSSAVVYNGMQLVMAWGDDPDPTAQVGFALINTATGSIMDVTPIIPDADFENGYSGGGVWGTPVVDVDTGYAYVGTSNPYSKKQEHANTNAIIKIDLNRGETFGQIVDSYKGTYDNYVPGLYDQPVCQAADPAPAGSYNLACAQLDIDFGSSPTLWKDADGDTLVGAIQKSGIFHAVHADTMDGAWTALLSAPLLLGNASPATIIDDQVVTSANPGIVWSLDDTSGAPNWVAPTLDGVRYQAQSSANGVVYTVDGYGNVDAFDAATGALLLQRSVPTDAGAGSASLLSSASVAIARNTVYAPNGGVLVAYGLPSA